MIPCCCLCGRKAKRFDDPEWKRNDFCPGHDKQVGKLKIYGNMVKQPIIAILLELIVINFLTEG